MAVAIIVTTAVIYQMGRFTLHAGQKIVDRQIVIDHLEGVAATLTDAETGQRGLLLTNNSDYLDPYHHALTRIYSELDALDGLAAAGELQGSDVKQLRQLADEKLKELEITIVLWNSNKRDAALDIVRQNTGKHIMDRIRDKVGQIVGQQKAQLADLRHAADRWTMYRSIIFVLCAAANLAFIAWTFGRVRREIAGRTEAAAEAARQSDLLAVTLASIGDAVIVTDTAARINFMNQEAQRLTGWDLADARGVDLARVFRIINEDTRQTVESPVEKVLRIGGIVGLANHTLLITKDGREIPIDDSGAPIRAPGGPIRGVVLVFRDFSEHKAAETKLRDSKAELELANQAKDRFMATLSHELRTPLMPVLTMLSAWEAGNGLSPAQRGDIQMMRRNVELEARLIDDLLDLTRITKGKLIFNPEAVDVNALVTGVTEMYQSEVHTKRLALSMRLDAQRNYVSADPARLHQVFWNILKNAVKFTPEGGRIEIATANREADGITVEFKDSGIGMSPRTLENLFVPFQQGAESITENYGGLGLGMAIAKALVDAQGGTIAAASEGMGRGSCFKVSLPSIETPATIQAPASSRDGAARRELKILLVEDHEDTADVISRLLRGKGHRVQSANSVASALHLARTEAFDIMLSDIGLPDGTGIDLIQQLRQHTKLPAVALTGFGMEEDVARCVEAGFAAHLTKPVNFQRLELMLQQTAHRDGNGA
jgi:PAS domain S-box-containing protein